MKRKDGKPNTPAMVQRWICPECGEPEMTFKQLEGTNACGKCEISDLPWEKPQELVCYTCKAKFTGDMADHPKYTMCPYCKKETRKYRNINVEVGLR